MRIASPSGRDLDLPRGATRLMGVLNVTPDSFSDGGRFQDVTAAVAHGQRLVAEGAHVLDIGGESTRPGHSPVPEDEQMRRVLPVLERLRPRVPVPISIDTTRARVARAALDAGADWINDTSALSGDPALAELVATRRAPIVLMHRFDPPRTGDAAEPRGNALIDLLCARMAAMLARARASGIADEQILLDPGIGFGTLPLDNVTILARIERLAALGRPLVVGPSRKSFLGHLTGKPAHERAFATAGTVTALALAGVAIVRVHDVAAMSEVVLVANAIARAAGGEAGSGAGPVRSAPVPVSPFPFLGLP